jgi:hypothetical protein
VEMIVNKDDIKRYIVQIKGIEFTGSGVLIQSNKNSYIFTAKHNLKSTEKQEVNDIEIEDIKEDIENGDIKILAPYSNIIIKDVIGLNDISIDFIILVVDKENSKGLEQLRVFNDDFKECVVAGYPTIRGDGSIEYFDCFYETKVEEDEGKDDYQNTFEVYSTKPLYTQEKKEMDTIVGISGGGVFVKGSDNNIYLAGIEIEYKGITNLVGISLRDIIDEINEKLKNNFEDKIETGGFSLYEKFGIDIKKLKLDSVKNEISEKNDYINRVLKEEKGKNNEYAFFKKYQNEYFKKINQEYKSVENLAKAFLYNGIVFHENQDYNRATRHFKKAVKLDPSLEVYFAQSKFQRKKGLSEKQKKEVEKNIANLSSNNEEQLIKNLKESIENKEELELKILKLNHLLYKKIDLSSFKWSVKNLVERVTKLDFKQIFIDTKIDIIKYTKELSDFYLEKKDFQNAQRQLKGLQQSFKLVNNLKINKKLLKIYEESQNDFFGNSCIDKKALLKELWDLMGRFEPNSDEYLKVKNMIQNNSIVDKNYSEFLEKIKQFEENYDKQIDSLSLGLKEISQNVVDKNVLMKIDFMLKDLTTSNNSLNLKMSNIEKDRLESKKFHQHILRIFKMIMQKGNRELEESIQHISNQNSIETRLMLNQLLRRFERGLDNLEIKEDEVDFATFNDELKEIVADEVNSFYTKIDKSKELIEEKNKIIRLIQKRYGEHVFSLERSLEDKNKETIALNTQLKDLNQWLDDINEKYETKKIRSLEVEEQFLKIRKEKDILKKNMLQVSDITNKSINLDKYKNEIKRLEKEVSRLNGKTEQLHELKESISLSSKTADSLVSLEKNYEDKIGLIEDRFKKIKHNPKNEKRLREIFKSILDLEKKLEEIKENNSTKSEYDPNITLRLVENDLKKIEKIMSKRKFNLYSLYCKTRFVIIGVIGMTLLLLYEPFWELCKQLLAF